MKKLTFQRLYLTIIQKGNYEDAKARIGQIYHSGRKDEIVMAEMVITLPKDVKKKMKDIFSECL